MLFQMLMSAQYRTETLELVGKFLDRGPYAVQKFLDVGILPYIRQLLTTPSRDYKYIMVLIWAKVCLVLMTFVIFLNFNLQNDEVFIQLNP